MAVALTPEQRERKRAKDAEYRHLNRDRLREYFRAHYAEHRAERAEYDRQRHLANPAAAVERAREWRQRHPARAAEHRRTWWDGVPLRGAASRAANTANRRARMYQAQGRIGYETVLDLWQQQPICVDCGEGRGLDHVIPLSRGGSNTSGNLANRCPDCNNRKGVRAA